MSFFFILRFTLITSLPAFSPSVPLEHIESGTLDPNKEPLLWYTRFFLLFFHFLLSSSLLLSVSFPSSEKPPPSSEEEDDDKEEEEEDGEEEEEGKREWACTGVGPEDIP